jgi:uncharacterized LabA/DUF88 family protein
MVFVDGENFTIRGQELSTATATPLVQGRYWNPDVFLWLPTGQIGVFSGFYPELPAIDPVRAYYYTSTVGDEARVAATRETIWAWGFTAQVFKKERRQRRTKGVDIALATDMLGGAYRGTYDTAVLVAGDGDYVPLVEEVKRLGRRVVVAFYGRGHGLNDELRLAADGYKDLDDFAIRRWKDYAEQVRQGHITDGEIRLPPQRPPTDPNSGSSVEVASSSEAGPDVEPITRPDTDSPERERSKRPSKPARR